MRKVRRNALAAKPPQRFHYLTQARRIGGKPVNESHYEGTHSTTSFDQASAYATGTVEKCRCGYPIVIELDVSGLKALPDVDALLEAENSVHDKYARDYMRDIVADEDHIQNVIDRVNDGSESDSDDYARAGDSWPKAAFQDMSMVNLPSAFLSVYEDDDKAFDALKHYTETGEVSDEVLAELTTQRRWLHDFDAKRVQAVYAFKPPYEIIMENWWEGDSEDSEETEREVAKIERAGYDVITEERVFESMDLIQTKKTLYEKKGKKSGQYHGTSSALFEQAIPEIKIPKEPPFPVVDPDDLEDEDEESEDE